MPRKTIHDTSAQKRFRTESRTVRPFDFEEHLLDGIAIRFSSDTDFTTEESIRDEELSREGLSPELKLDFDPAILKERYPILNESLRLIVAVEDRALKKKALAYQASVTECAGTAVTLNPSFCKRFSWGGTMKITVAVVLAENRTAPLGQATKAGNWLAKKEFSFSTANDRPIFNIQSVPPEAFKRFRLPLDTAYYVEIIAEDFNQPYEDAVGLFTVWMNESVSQMLFKIDDSKTGQAVARSIFTDISATILSAGFSRLAEGEQLDEKGFLHTAAKRISDSMDIDIQTITSMGRDAGGSRLRSLLQSQTNLTKALSSLTSRG